MIIDKHLNRVKQADQLIRQKSTGTPKQLGKCLNISERQVYNLIDELRAYGAPICYDRYRHTYYYTRPVKINATICVEELSAAETFEITGGYTFLGKIVPLQFFCSVPA